MADVLVRNLDPTTIHALDAAAERLGLSRNEYLRRELDRLARPRVEPTTRADLIFLSTAAADLADEDVMTRAWS